VSAAKLQLKRKGKNGGGYILSLVDEKTLKARALFADSFSGAAGARKSFLLHLPLGQSPTACGTAWVPSWTAFLLSGL